MARCSRARIFVPANRRNVSPNPTSDAVTNGLAAGEPTIPVTPLVHRISQNIPSVQNVGPRQQAYATLTNGNDPNFKPMFVLQKRSSAQATLSRLGLQLAPEKFNILLLGETGSGKSTLINCLTNYFYGVNPLTDPIRIAIPNRFYPVATETAFDSSEHSSGDQSASQTLQCNSYAFCVASPSAPRMIFNLIDTPGLSDTRGGSQDDDNLEAIMNAAERAASLAAVLIVINGRSARLTVNMSNTLTRISGSLPDVFLQNVLVVLTNCSKRNATFDLSTLGALQPKQQSVFYMDNSVFGFKISDFLSSDRDREAISADWNSCMRAVDAIVRRVASLGPISTSVLTTLRAEKNKALAELQTVLAEVETIQKLQDLMAAAEAVRTNVASDIAAYSNFKSETQVEVIKLVPAAFHSLTCNNHRRQLCHENCGLQFMPYRESFADCECFDGGTGFCSSCGCTEFYHFHAKLRFKAVKQTVETILHDVKAKYEASRARDNEVSAQIQEYDADLVTLRRTLDEKCRKIGEICQSVKGICAGFSFEKELHCMVAVMQANARTLTQQSAREDADVMIRKIQMVLRELLSAP